MENYLFHKYSFFYVGGNNSGEAAQDKYEQEEEDEEYGEEGEEEEDCDCEEVEDEEEQSIMFEKRATLFTSNEGEQGWKNLGMGNLKMIYDSDIFGARIIMEADNSGEIISNSVISVDTTMQVIEQLILLLNYCYLKTNYFFLKLFVEYNSGNFLSKGFWKGMHLDSF